MTADDQKGALPVGAAEGSEVERPVIAEEAARQFDERRSRRRSEHHPLPSAGCALTARPTLAPIMKPAASAFASPSQERAGR